jgi:2-methylcitrate dehydratase PrpD
MLDAAIATRNQLGLETASDMAEIAHVSVAAPAATIADNFTGAQHKRRPTQIVEAQFALPYLIAAALVNGRVGITEVADIDNPRVLTIAAGMQGTTAEPRESGVTILLRDGRSASATLGQPLGSPANPISIEQLRMKFTDCARNAVRPLADQPVLDAADAILRLESVPDVSLLLRQFS